MRRGVGFVVRMGLPTGRVGLCRGRDTRQQRLAIHRVPGGRGPFGGESLRREGLSGLRGVATAVLPLVCGVVPILGGSPVILRENCVRPPRSTLGPN